MDLERVLINLLQPAALAELAALALCLLFAGFAVRILRRRMSGSSPKSIWLGEQGTDGALFPLLALGFAYLSAWLLGRWVPLAVFRLAEPVLLSLLVIRIVVRVLAASFPRSVARLATERSVTWLAWIVVLLWVLGVLGPLVDSLRDLSWKIGSTRMSVLGVVEVVLVTAAVLVVSLWISSAIERRLLRHADPEDLSTRKMAANLVRALLLFIGLMLVLPAVGVDLTALSVLSGAIGVGLGFGFQKIASNYVSGFVILGERSLRIGDMVKVDDFEGRISDIRTRYTMVCANDGREAIVPNEMLITQRVENASLSDRRVSVSTVVQVAYGTDLKALFPELLAGIAEVDRVLSDPAPSVLLSNFAADGLELTLFFWVRDPEQGIGGPRSNVNLLVLDTLNRLGIEIPFPQRVVHQLPPAPVHEVSSGAP